MYKREDLQRVLKIKDFQNISLEQYAFSHFHSYANLCQICFSHERDTRLKRCTRCKMVYYCGKRHQKLHWSPHKHFCKVATGLHAICGGSNLFEKMKTENQQVRIDWKNRLVDLIEAGLKRKLIPYEKSLIFFPKLCCVCYEADPKLLKFCTRCPHGNFCEEHYEDPSHLKYCNLFSYGLIVNGMGVTFKAGPIPGIIESVPYNTKTASLPANMQVFLKRFCKFGKFEKVFKQIEIQMYMSEHLTRPLTVLYAMQKLRFHCQKTMTIHVIGSNNFEEVGQQSWEILLHWLPNLISLRIVLIGPECATANSQITICRVCNVKDKKLYVESYGLLYKDYFESRIFTKPDIVVGFNAGLKIYNSWTDSLLMLTRVKCPFILTTFWEEEIDIDHEIMLKTFGHFARYTFREKNPFASLRPYRDVVNIKIFSRNCGILIYTKLAQSELFKTNSAELFIANQIKSETLNKNTEQRITRFSDSVSEEI